jgi:hypothetical protein
MRLTPLARSPRCTAYTLGSAAMCALSLSPARADPLLVSGAAPLATGRLLIRPVGIQSPGLGGTDALQPPLSSRDMNRVPVSAGSCAIRKLPGQEVLISKACRPPGTRYSRPASFHTPLTRYDQRTLMNRHSIAVAVLSVASAPAFAGSITFTTGNLVPAAEGCGVYGGTCTSIQGGTGPLRPATVTTRRRL